MKLLVHLTFCFGFVVCIPRVRNWDWETEYPEYYPDYYPEYYPEYYPGDPLPPPQYPDDKGM